MDSPFDVLHVDPDADEDEIKRAYRERVKEAHPDRGGSVEEFRTVRQAYEKIKAGYREPAKPTERDSTKERDRTQEPAETTEPDNTDDQSRTRERSPKVTSQVTYLDYDVITDFGWETDDDDLFRKAAAADLDEIDYGEFEVEPGESLLEAAEDRGFAWPFACRGGACANCAIVLREGELSMPASHVLPADLMDRGFRLSCNGMPITDELKVIYNVKHMPELDDLLLPPRPFQQAYPND